MLRGAGAMSIFFSGGWYTYSIQPPKFKMLVVPKPFAKRPWQHSRPASSGDEIVLVGGTLEDLTLKGIMQ